MGVRASIVATFITVVFMAIMWQVGETYRNIPFFTKILLCGVVWFVSHVFARMVSK